MVSDLSGGVSVSSSSPMGEEITTSGELDGGLGGGEGGVNGIIDSSSDFWPPMISMIVVASLKMKWRRSRGIAGSPLKTMIVVDFLELKL